MINIILKHKEFTFEEVLSIAMIKLYINSNINIVRTNDERFLNNVIDNASDIVILPEIKNDYTFNNYNSDTGFVEIYNKCIKDNEQIEEFINDIIHSTNSDLSLPKFIEAFNARNDIYTPINILIDYFKLLNYKNKQI